MEEKERRNHGCDGCHCDIPTERFDGYNGSTLWICSMCQQELIKNGIPNQKLNAENKTQGDSILLLLATEIILKIEEEWNRRRHLSNYEPKDSTHNSD